jgi:hypothetical protein
MQHHLPDSFSLTVDYSHILTSKGSQSVRTANLGVLLYLPQGLDRASQERF